MTLPAYTVTFRGLPACPCQATWIPVFERELQDRGLLAAGQLLRIYQLIGGYSGSGGTHLDGGASDFLDLLGDEEVEVARQMGADATWTRPYDWDGAGGIAHNHSVLRDCPHNSPARYQIDAVDAGFNGLGTGGRGAPDTGPRPLSGRTWREGIAWANQQQEERDMAEFGQRILDAVNRLEDHVKASAKADRERAQRKHEAVLALLDKLADDVADDASKAQVKRLRVAIEKLAAPDVIDPPDEPQA